MHIICRYFTAQHTRLQFRTYTAAGRTNQGIQNRSIHLTRGWVKIRFRGHSTGWWIYMIEFLVSCISDADCGYPWIIISQGGLPTFAFSAIFFLARNRACSLTFFALPRGDSKIKRLQCTNGTNFVSMPLTSFMIRQTKFRDSVWNPKEIKKILQFMFIEPFKRFFDLCRRLLFHSRYFSARVSSEISRDLSSMSTIQDSGPNIIFLHSLCLHPARANYQS